MNCKCPTAGKCSGALFLVLAIVFVSRPISGGARVVNPPPPLRTLEDVPGRERMKAATQALQEGWFPTTPSDAQTWAGINAWQRFVVVDALAQYTEISGDKAYLPQIERAVENHDGLDGNDDDLWAVVASVHVYRLRPSDTLLAFSKTKFRELTEQYWDGTCGGGMWWDHERTYKNAITNELLLYAASELYQATSDPAYAAWAQKEWVWFSRSGMINSDNLVNDGLTAQCRNNGGTTYTYNQGVILGGLVNLYGIDGNSSHIQLATAIAQAAIQHLSVAGILREPAKSLHQDGQTFKGVFVYHLAALVPLAGDPTVRKSLSSFLNKNADAVWNRRQPHTNKLDAYWEGATTAYGAAAQAAGLDLFEAAFRTGDNPGKPAIHRNEPCGLKNCPIEPH